MKEEILKNLNNPNLLERLYRNNKATFKKEFNLLFSQIQDNPTAQVWNERLNFYEENTSLKSNNELLIIFIASLIAGLIAKIPQLFSVQSDFFYSRNCAFIVFPLLTAYFAWRKGIPIKKGILVSFSMLTAIIFINLFPDKSKSDTLVLSCIHLPLFLWALLGYTFVGDQFKNYTKRVDFLRYNGDLVVMTTLIVIAGALLTGITIGLFSLIHVEISEFYFKYIVVWGLAASPIVATYLVQTNPQLVNRVSPIIAKVFTPLVLITLVAYLIAVIGKGKDPYNDRDFLFIFNMLLIGVMAIIFFSIAETSKHSESKIGTLLLLALSLVTILINGIAISAILFRISEWGITPNRLAVLGGNILILTNLLVVSYSLFNAFRDKNKIENVEKSIAKFLPLYSYWTICVTFIFPLLYNFN